MWLIFFHLRLGLHKCDVFLFLKAYCRSWHFSSRRRLNIHIVVIRYSKLFVTANVLRFKVLGHTCLVLSWHLCFGVTENVYYSILCEMGNVKNNTRRTFRYYFHVRTCRCKISRARIEVNTRRMI